MSKDEYIRAVMTAPNIKNSERNYNIVYQLQSVKLVNDLVSGAFLYIPSDDTFYSSGWGGGAVKAEEYKGTGQINRLLEFCRNAKSEVGEHHMDLRQGRLPCVSFPDRISGRAGDLL